MKIPLDTTFDNKDPYKVLGVTADAAPIAIQKAYLNLARRSHPDLFATDPEKYRSATTLMQDINAAYGLLSDPAQREFWDRRHPAARPTAPRRTARRPVPRRPVEPSPHYEAEQVRVIIRKYNEFSGSLRTAAERQAVARRIRKFQASRAGAAYIRELVNRHYRQVMDLLNLGRRVSVYDDGLVEMMFLFDGALEIIPGSVFITYAYLVYLENRGRFPVGLAAAKRLARDPDSVGVRIRLPEPRPGPAARKPGSPRTLGARVWDWLMAKPWSDRH